MYDKVVLNFDNPYNPKEEAPEDFETSLFRGAYKKIGELIGKIVRKNDKLKKHEDTIDYIYNIIPIIGPRGCGKTTVMQSTLKYLGDFSNPHRKQHSKYFDPCKGTGFIVLSPIDAGHLEDSENLFGIVLARMLAHFNNLSSKKDDEFSNKPVLYQKFTKIYNEFLNVNSDAWENKQHGKSALKVLADLDASQNLRSTFKELVKLFQSCIASLDETKGINSTDSYLVIPIDDIDMNIKNTHKMLEQIQTYMMIPRVIIILTANYDNLMCNCENYYTDSFKEVIHASAVIEKYLGQKFIDSCVELSQEYLNKLFPAGKMVHLRHDRKHDAAVRFDDKRLSNLYNLENIEYEKYSNIIVAKIAQSTGIYFYGGGKNKSFIEPNSIRSMGQFITKMMSMLTPYEIYKTTPEYSAKHNDGSGNDNGSDLETVEKTKRNIKENRKILLDDIRVRYICSLSEAERWRIARLADIRIEKLCHATAQTMIDIIKEDEESGRKERRTAILANGEKVNFTFDNIYSLKLEDIFIGFDIVNQIAFETYGDFSEAILALFSVKLRMAQESSYEDGGKSDIDMLNGYIGRSIFGNFNNKIVRQLTLANDSDSDQAVSILRDMGYTTIGRNRSITIQIGAADIHAFMIFLLFLESQAYDVTINATEQISDDEGGTGNGGIPLPPNKDGSLKRNMDLALEIRFRETVRFGLPYMFVNVCTAKAEEAVPRRFLKNSIMSIDKHDTVSKEVRLRYRRVLNRLKRGYDTTTIFNDKLPAPLLDVELMYNIMQNIRAQRINTPTADAWGICKEYFAAVYEELRAVDEIHKNVRRSAATAFGFADQYEKRMPGCAKSPTFMKLSLKEAEAFNNIVGTLLS